MLGEIVLKVLANACNIDRSLLAPDTSLADVGFDSLGAAAFASEMETAHGIVIEPGDLAKLYVAVTPVDVIALVGEVYMRSGPGGAVATTA
jgi:acyl carrier protein